MNEFQGYSLFNDVEDKELRTYNRARVMKTMMLDNQVDRNVTAQGVYKLMTYMDKIPEDERRAVYHKLEELLQQKETA